MTELFVMKVATGISLSIVVLGFIGIIVAAVQWNVVIRDAQGLETCQGAISNSFSLELLILSIAMVVTGSWLILHFDQAMNDSNIPDLFILTMVFFVVVNIFAVAMFIVLIVEQPHQPAPTSTLTTPTTVPPFTPTITVAWNHSNLSATTHIPLANTTTTHRLPRKTVQYARADRCITTRNAAVIVAVFECVAVFVITAPCYAAIATGVVLGVLFLCWLVCALIWKFAHPVQRIQGLAVLTHPFILGARPWCGRDHAQWGEVVNCRMAALLSG